ncbi:MAG: methyltransferase domain-containing protein [SAR202 cluster bacterium]|nr:methyltransferase domain-containing protein [SAR202 cluster bacterium]
MEINMGRDMGEGNGKEAGADFDTSFGTFAIAYDDSIGDTGDFAHRNTIDPPLFSLAGDVAGKVVYDLGCGNGYISRRMVREGAREVWASDISEEMIALAKSGHPSTGISYSVHDAARFDGIPTGHFDLVVMNMVIHLVADLDALAKGIHALLKPGGRFVFSMDHPLRYVAYKAIDAYDVDIVAECENYLVERATQTYNNWSSRENLKMYSRPFGSYLNACGRNGLYVQEVREPKTVTGSAANPMRTGVPYKMAVLAVKVS